MRRVVHDSRPYGRARLQGRGDTLDSHTSPSRVIGSSLPWVGGNAPSGEGGHSQGDPLKRGEGNG